MLIWPHPLSTMACRKTSHRLAHVGTGTRLYHMVASGSTCYVIVRTRALNQDGSVTVNASDGKTYLLLTDPSITHWAVSIYADWKEWDAKIDWTVMEDRSDYEPWAFKTREAFIDSCRTGADALYRG